MIQYHNTDRLKLSQIFGNITSNQLVVIYAFYILISCFKLILKPQYYFFVREQYL